MPLVAGVGLLAAWCVACSDTAPVTTSGTRPPVKLTASVDKAEATTGDVITYRVTLESDPAITVAFPEVFSKITGFKVSDISHEGPVERDGRRVESRAFTLRAFAPGSYVLPELSVTYTDANGKEQTTGAPKIFVEIKSVLDENAQQEDIADIKSPVLPPPNYRPLVLMGVGVLVLAGAVVLVVYLLRKRRGRGEPPPPPIPPWEEALDALDTLERGHILDEGDYRAYGFALSEIVRRYLERRFGFPAMENTTEEIMRALRATDASLGKPMDQVHRLLTTTDLLKFAKGSIPVEEAGELLDVARSFVRATTPPPVEPAEQGSTEGGGS